MVGAGPRVRVGEEIRDTSGIGGNCGCHLDPPATGEGAVRKRSTASTAQESPPRRATRPGRCAVRPVNAWFRALALATERRGRPSAVNAQRRRLPAELLWVLPHTTVPGFPMTTARSEGGARPSASLRCGHIRPVASHQVRQSRPHVSDAGAMLGRAAGLEIRSRHMTTAGAWLEELTDYCTPSPMGERVRAIEQLKLLFNE